MKNSILCVLVFTLFAFLLAGCKEEGPAEKAGRAVDETIEKIKHGDEGKLEKTGRKLDEAIADTQKKLKESQRDE